MNTLNENKPPIAQSSANGATFTDVLGTDIVEMRPLGEFRMWTPSRRFVPEQLQQRYFARTRDGLTGEVWISGMMHLDTGIFVPN